MFVFRTVFARVFFVFLLAFIIVLGVGSGAIGNLWWLSLLARTPASRAATAPSSSSPARA